MEIIQSELVALAEVVDSKNEEQRQELSELQLSLVGGGAGDILFG